MKDYDVLAVGDLNTDLILSIAGLPEFGREVLAQSLARRSGGVAANFAAYCARLGLRVALLARVGRDGDGDFLLAEMQRLGVVTEHVVRDPELPTGITVSLSGPSDRAFVTYLGTIDSLRGGDAPDELLARARWVHVGSYFMQSKLQPDLPDLLHRARQAGAVTSLDTGYDPAETWDSGLPAALAETTLFLPNEVEAQGITGEADVDRAAAKLLAMTETVALKLGGAGARYLSGETTLGLGPYAVNVVDTTCCGDAFDAGFIAAALLGKKPGDCLAWGNACGALVASGAGNAADLVSRSAVEEVVASGSVSGPEAGTSAPD